MPNPSATTTRAWLNRTLAAAGDTKTTLEDRGLVVSGPIEWVDADQVRIVATFHGDSVTIATPDESAALRQWTMPVGWAKAA
jgi:hypothetical protein